ncbi:MAG: 5-formyltetrahydrofolate cyclo-ligase [Nitrospirae bacterium]|nr:5-formyltetrahydrofolate cyclo-ligase [Nitrospirota bacterium]
MKKDLRKQLLKRRNGISPEDREKKSAEIIRRLFDTPDFKNAKSILFYASFKSEVETAGCLNSAIKLGKKIAVPLVDKKASRLRLYEIKDASELQSGFMGIPEPAVLEGREKRLKDFDLVVVPGVGFDVYGNRLGYGAGYYDKLLSNSESQVVTIALAFEEQIVSEIQGEEHDVKMDKIITEKRTIDCELEHG